MIWNLRGTAGLQVSVYTSYMYIEFQMLMWRRMSTGIEVALITPGCS